MFSYAPFNQAIGSWNTAQVTDMASMFYSNSAFNQAIGSWNTAQMTNMYWMFRSTSFNQAIGSWNTSKVTNMDRMFESSAFNQAIGGWNTVQVMDMAYMFQSATAFAGNCAVVEALCTWGKTKEQLYIGGDCPETGICYVRGTHCVALALIEAATRAELEC
jgi:surface protein